MPQVLVFINSRYQESKTLNELFEFKKLVGEGLPRFVAAALTVPGVNGAGLSHDEVEVNFISGDPEDRCHEYDVQIIVFANHFKEREENLQERTDKIKIKLSRLFMKQRIKVKGFLYVRLAPAGFSEF